GKKSQHRHDDQSPKRPVQSPHRFSSPTKTSVRRELSRCVVRRIVGWWPDDGKQEWLNDRKKGRGGLWCGRGRGSGLGGSREAHPRASQQLRQKPRTRRSWMFLGPPAVSVVWPNVVELMLALKPESLLVGPTRNGVWFNRSRKSASKLKYTPPGALNRFDT